MGIKPSPFLCVSTGKQRSDRPEPSPFYVHCTASLRHIHPVRHAKHPKQILQTKHTFTTKLRGRPFDSAGGGGGVAVYVESVYLFSIFCGRQYLFSSNFRTDHLL